MDPNRFAAAPYEPTAGARRPGLGSLWQDPLIVVPLWHPSKNGEMGGASVLGGRRFFNRHNNQPKFGCGGGGGALVMRRDRGGTRGEDFFLSFWAANGATKK
jgi:hypothetical protein